MAWRLAEGLDKLRDQIDAAWPNRSKVSDGSIGDAAHATTDSDHNPWVKDGAMGVVTAIDVTNDPAHGVDNDNITKALVSSRDSRIKYIIWNRRIVAGNLGPFPWVWRAYSGDNPHDKHFHISIKSDKPHYDDRSPWKIKNTIKEMRWELWRTVDPHRVEESIWVVDTDANRRSRLTKFAVRVAPRFAALKVAGKKPAFRANTREV